MLDGYCKFEGKLTKEAVVVRGVSSGAAEARSASGRSGATGYNWTATANGRRFSLAWLKCSKCRQRHSPLKGSALVVSPLHIGRQKAAGTPSLVKPTACGATRRVVSPVDGGHAALLTDRLLEERRGSFHRNGNPAGDACVSSSACIACGASSSR